MDYKTVADLAECIRTRLPEKMPGDVDLVVGIPPSGTIAASLISLRLNRRVLDVDGYLAASKRKGPKSDPKHILLVDDSVTTGLRCETAKKTLIAATERAGDRITSLAVYGVPGASGGCDITLEDVPLPRLFEWSYMHHALLADSCLCLDGVLCSEPRTAESDDGGHYRKFLKTTPPLIIPSVEIGAIITCRLEKYRSLTEDWLHRHGIRYRNLIMMETLTKTTKTVLSNRWQFKVNAFKRTAGRLFIENDPVQAKAIAQQSLLPVLCVSLNKMIDP